MLFQKSDLQLLKFNILEYRYNFIAEKSIQTDLLKINEILNDLPIEIEFFLAETERPYTFNIFCKININKELIDGYSIFTEGVGIFTFEDAENKKVEAHSGNALGMTINKLREYIFYSTSLSPYGSFTLPLVDLQKIIELKNNPNKENR